MAKRQVAVIDAGTTNVKAHLINPDLSIAARSTQPISKRAPHSCWVEQDPQEIFHLAMEQLSKVLTAAEATPLGIGITNQRETFIVWDGQTGEPIYPAIVWEDTRAEDFCQQLNQNPTLVQKVLEATGLPINSYFSAAKLRWLLRELKPTHPERLRFGTVDSWLLYRLTGTHATDYTNAARTLLFNIRSLGWDTELLDLFDVPASLLPPVRPSFYSYGSANLIHQQSLPALALVGDQQASLYAAGSTAGTIKITYGTGIFPMKLVDKFELLDGLYTTLAVGPDEKPLYALEGKVSNAAGRVSPVLNQPDKLEPVIKQLVQETQPILDQLVDNKTTRITIDGGISQSDILLAEQSRLAGVKVVRQIDHDGTAIGVAKLIFANWRG